MAIYYIEDDNGQFKSIDGERRFKRLDGKEAYWFLKTSKGKSSVFMKVNEYEDGGEDVFFEIPIDKKNNYEQYKRRKRYNNDLLKKSGYKVISFFSNSNEEKNDCMTGEDKIPDDRVDVFEEVCKSINLQKLKKALASLDDDEYDLIRELFLANQPMTLSEYAKKAGVHFTTVQYRRDRILAKMRRFF